MNRTALTCTAVAWLSVLGAAALIAGPLDPPAGAVAPTHKTLTEVEPRIAISTANTPGDADSLFKITQPGSYYLTGNITGVPSRHGIEIAASGVTLDLGGFGLVGVAGMGTFDGVTVSVAGLTNIVVRDGSVRNWGDDGVDLQTFGPVGCLAERVHASGNEGVGIILGNDGRVWGCSARGGSSNGLAVGAGGSVIDSTAQSNAGTGILAGLGCAIRNCAANANTGSGIGTSSGNTITGCSAYNNGGAGFSIASGSTITDCSARSNILDGIVCSSQSLVRANVCSLNGFNGDGAGIHATGVDNRIEANSCTGSDRGIDVDQPGNVIFRNTCSGNTTNNWEVVAGNIILVVNATPAGLVTGNNGGVAPGSTDPNANFTH